MNDCQGCGKTACECNKPLDIPPFLHRDKCVMPRALTAENGAKAALSGEFFETIKVFCLECDGSGLLDEEMGEECCYCKGSGEQREKVYVSWTTIKQIYAMAVKHLAI